MKKHAQKFLIAHYADARKDSLRDCAGNGTKRSPFFLTMTNFYRAFASSVSSSPEWRASTSSPVQFCIWGCDLLLKGSVLFMSWEMTGKAPYLLAQLCLIPCFPLPIGILSICLCCTQLFLPSHLERQCCGNRILFKFIFINIATGFSIRLLKHYLHLYLTWDNLQVPTMCQKKSKERNENLLQLSPEPDVFVDMSGKRKPESTVRPKRSNEWPMSALLYWTVVKVNGNDRI